MFFQKTNLDENLLEDSVVQYMKEELCFLSESYW